MKEFLGWLAGTIFTLLILFGLFYLSGLYDCYQHQVPNYMCDNK